ncbi:MAG: hypothetical protein GQ531_11535 [Sulfurovum sp.]|nr:hypothetical protein [Sulfurovum sp.]
MKNSTYNKPETSKNKNISKKDWVSPNLSTININQTKGGFSNGNENQGNTEGNNSNSKLG